MAERSLQGKKVAALFTDGVEQVEFVSPRQALEEAGAEVTVISLKTGPVKAWDHTDWGETFNADLSVEDADPEAFDALLLPGGVMNPDKLRMNRSAVAFVRRMVESGKPVAAICHGPWMLVEADVVRGRTLTSYPSIQTDIINAGGIWVDREVVVDHGLVTSRNPNDLPAFNGKMVEEFREGPHERQLATAGRAQVSSAAGEDVVTQASEESFPASDPPGA